MQAQGRAVRRVKLLVNVQTALQKYYNGGDNGMTDKDWGDIIRRVLPESKAEGLMKDLKKSDAIIAKLATLNREWTTYIPPIEAVKVCNSLDKYLILRNHVNGLNCTMVFAVVLVIVDGTHIFQENCESVNTDKAWSTHYYAKKVVLRNL